MVNLIIDLGNTFSKLAWFEDQTLVESHTKIPYEALLELLSQTTTPPQNAIVSSTSHGSEEILAVLSQQNCQTLLLDAQTPVPIQKNYDTPQTLGSDRVAAAVGANTLYPAQNCLVIDMGTCITYDLMDAAGVFQGGIISLGLRMRFAAMQTFTTRLPLIEADGIIPPLIGKNTTHAMQSGVMNGMAAELNGIIAQYHQLIPDLRILVCGGDAPFFESSLKHSIFAEPNLVLVGLNRILQYNNH